jgi:hypothetical protein
MARQLASMPTRLNAATWEALTPRPRHRNEIIRVVADRLGARPADVAGSVSATLSALKAKGMADNPQRAYWRRTTPDEGLAHWRRALKGRGS